MAAASLSKEIFEKAVINALKKVNLGGITVLTEPQSKSLFNYLCGKDTFVSLPTGHGKSLIYQLCPVVAEELVFLGFEQFPTDPIVVVISPLNSLIKDQISSCERMAIKACKVDCESLVTLQDKCDFKILYASPEIFDTQDARKLLQKYCDRVIGIVVDESHCIVQWGTANKRDQPFRESYGRIGHLRSFSKAPFMCMTATASIKIRSKILKLLNMNNVKFIRQSPDKKNVSYSVEKANELDETFQWMLNLLNGPLTEIPKTIIYCRSLKDCGEIYSLFNENRALCDSMVVTMYHSKTPENIKEKVLSSLLEEDGECRVVIATSALGMGVNIPNVRRIIHYGAPSDLESYLQEVGRGGRDGKPCKATIYYRPFHLAHCDENMRNFVKNTEKKCRRDVLMKYFKDKANVPDSKHDCCDVCQAACKCGTCTCSTAKLPLVEPEDCDLPTMARKVQEEEREFLYEMLNEIPTCSGTVSSVFGSAGLSSELDEDVIKEIVSKCDYIFSISYIMDNFHVFSKEVANEILTIVNEIFNDIDEAEFLSSIDNSLIADMLFLDVEEQASGSDSEGLYSDIELFGD